MIEVLNYLRRRGAGAVVVDQASCLDQRAGRRRGDEAESGAWAPSTAPSPRASAPARPSTLGVTEADPGFCDLPAADVVLTGRDPARLEQASRGLAARSSAAFDADDAASVKHFFAEPPAPIDHVLVTAYTRRSYGPCSRSPPRRPAERPG